MYCSWADSGIFADLKLNTLVDVIFIAKVPTLGKQLCFDTQRKEL